MTQRFWIRRVHDGAKLTQYVTLAEGIRALSEYFIGGSCMASYILEDNEGSVFASICPGDIRTHGGSYANTNDRD